MNTCPRCKSADVEMDEDVGHLFCFECGDYPFLSDQDLVEMIGTDISGYSPLPYIDKLMAQCAERENEHG